ncbi:MAG: argininosuccinate lyase [Coriobacteriales bacterium]|jgi:argininosuccinate lyase|nr:argininosuccinate lyase [Coriobacteriales bacterium]
MSTQLWAGRFEAAPDEAMQTFGASLPIDWRLWREDIAGSRAHARMLAAQGVISEQDALAITAGLGRIAARIEAGDFDFRIADEDIHMAIESALIADIGDAGRRLHTGRSRNDQVATDMRLYLLRRTRELAERINRLRATILKLAEDNPEVILPGYTHLQKAQPVLFAHHLLAWFWMFSRDFGRFKTAHRAADASPLGAAALAGSGYPLDRQMTAAELGFSQVIPNSLDAVSDRDFLLDALFACTTTVLHLSRLAEELILWSSEEFGFITLADAFSTGSSIMPQKKNPDFAELVRGRTGRIVGDLVGLITVLKGLPLAYNKDLQEDKKGVFDALDTLELALGATDGMLATLRVNSEHMFDGAQGGYMAATDLADFLVTRGLPFRRAHELVGRLVLLAEKTGRRLSQLTTEELLAADENFADLQPETLAVEHVVARRTTEGGTAPVRVAEQLLLAHSRLREDAAALNFEDGEEH